MATAAPYNAHRSKAKVSTGPKTEAGEAIARLDTLTHGERAGSFVPVLPQEDPDALKTKIREWVEDLRPRDDAERDLVERAARITWLIDRAERCETARLARRVRKAQFRS